MKHLNYINISLWVAISLMAASCTDQPSALSGPKATEETITDPTKEHESEQAGQATEGSIIAPRFHGVHPRLLVTDEQLQAASAVWKENPGRYRFLADTRGFESRQPRPMQEATHGWDDGRALLLCGALYAVTKHPSYKKAIHRWIQEGIKPGFVTDPQLIKIEGIGVQNKDLDAGQFLITSAILYDLLIHDSAYQQQYPEDLDVLEKALMAQAAQTYEDLSRLTRVPYEQNHFYIAASGLGLAALALTEKLPEQPEIQQWHDYAYLTMDRSHQILSSDGFYYEGFSYWSAFYVYATIYAEALMRANGVNWLTTKTNGEAGLLTDLDVYLAHISLPKPGRFYGYADYGPMYPWKGYDKPLGEIDARLAFYPLIQMQEYSPSPLVSKLLQRGWKSHEHAPPQYVNFVDCALTLLRLPLLKKGLDKTPALAGIPPYHYFSDHEVIAWRKAWNSNQEDPETVFFFKCGPPEGHTAAEYRKAFPEWKMGMGHVQPDAASFNFFSRGEYLATSSGYSMAKKTDEHNCLLVDGKGQFKEGTPWKTFDERDYDRYTQLRLNNVWLASSVASATADVAAAYFPKLDHYERQLILVDGRWLAVRDKVTAEESHAYSWVLNSEKPFRNHTGVEDAWITTNGAAALTVFSLNEEMEAEMAPTRVTVGFDPEPVIAERAHHLKLTTPRLPEAVITNVVRIGASADETKAEVTAEGDNAIRIVDGDSTCTIFLGPEARFDGISGYYWDEGGAWRSMGLNGSRMEMPGNRSIELTVAGQIVLNLQNGTWQVEAHMPETGTLIVQEAGEIAATLDLPKGPSMQLFDWQPAARK